MTVAPTAQSIAEERMDAIADLFRQGRRVSEVIAHGLNGSNNWRKAEVIDVLNARGWRLDSDGRIPRQHRATGITPVGTLPGAPAAAPGTPVSWPENGTVTVDRSSIPQLIADGRAHTSPKVRRLADRADTAIKDLRAAVADESGREEIRKRLAELDAERDRLRAQLGGAKPRTTPAPSTKPIDHGSERGARQHNLRGDPLCADCRPFQEVIVAKLRGGRKQTA